MIRPYLPQDKEQVMALFRLNTPKYFALEEEKDLIHYLDYELEGYFVFEENGKVLGAGGYNIEDSVGIISWYFVDPETQGRGVGKALLEHSLQALRDIPNITDFRVRTSQHAWKFFERFGFELVKTETDYWAKGIDLYQMEM